MDPYKAALDFGLAVVAVGVGPTLFEYDSWLASVLMTGGIAVFALGLFSIVRGLVERGRRHEAKNVEPDADDEGCMRSIYVIVLIYGLCFAVIALGKSLDMSLTTFFVSVYIAIVVFAFVWSYSREHGLSCDGHPETQ